MLFCANNAGSKSIIWWFIIILYEKLKNYSIQSLKECLLFVFCMFCFLLLSNNTLHVMFYTYICYWNTCRKTISCVSDFKSYLLTLYLIISFLFIDFSFSLGARDGFIQPIFAKGLTPSVCKSDKMHKKDSRQLWRHWRNNSWN